MTHFKRPLTLLIHDMRESITYFVSQDIILVGMLTTITQMALMVDVSVVSAMVGFLSPVMCPEREQRVVNDPKIFLDHSAIKNY